MALQVKTLTVESGCMSSVSKHIWEEERTNFCGLSSDLRMATPTLLPRGEDNWSRRRNEDAEEMVLAAVPVTAERVSVSLLAVPRL